MCCPSIEMKNKAGALGPSRVFFLVTVLSPAENSRSDLHSFGRAPSPAITVAKLRHGILIDSGRLSKKMKVPLYCSHRGNLALNVCTDSEGKSRLPTFHARLPSYITFLMLMLSFVPLRNI